MSRRTRALCGSEIVDTAIGTADEARIGYLSIKAPLAHTYEQTPQTYKCGLNQRGQIIGRNATVPYPGELPKYHDIPILRNVDWVGKSYTSTGVHLPDFNSVSTCTGDSYENTLGGPEIDEYFTADTDEGYRKWAEKREMTCEEQVKEDLAEKQRERVRECMQDLSADSVKDQKSSVNHYMPVHFPTTNQTYGSYIDLADNYLTIRKLRPNKPNTVIKNISLPSIDTSHQDRKKIATMLGLEPDTKSSRTTYIVSFNRPESLHMVGQRDKCNTFPAHAPTGLEMNRIPASNRTLFSTLEQEQLLNRPNRTSLAKIPAVQTLRTAIPYATPQTRPGFGHTPPAYIYLETKKFGL